MKPFKLSAVTLGILTTLGTLPAYAAVVGKVIAIAGEASVTRQGADIKLALGAPIESGDLIKLGEPGNLQVRFNDEAIVALRSNSQLRVDNYVYAQKPESDTVLLSLLKGGMRTITGVIGRVSRSNYAVNTPTSTIGIRGTHYTLMQCDNDCRNPDGSTASNGTFGGVTDGRIAVTNDAGEREFGRDEFFFVSSRAALPESLLMPPTFLRDRLEGQARAGGKGTPTTASGQESTTAASNTTADSASVSPGIVTGIPVAVSSPVLATEQIGIVRNTVTPFYGFADFALAGAVSGKAFDNNTLLLPEPERSEAVSRYQYLFTQSTALSTSQGSSAEAGNVYWGHWFGTGGTTGGGSGEHWIVGVPTPAAALPSSGAYTYNWIGGTNPTDNFGNIGKVTNGGSLNVDFVDRRVNTVTPLAWTVGGRDYSLSVSNLIFSQAGSGTRSLTCGTCTSSSVDISGNFTGSSGEGVITGISTLASFADGSSQETATAQVYGRYTPPALTPAPNPTPTPTPVPEPIPTPTPTPVPEPTPTPNPGSFSASWVSAESYTNTFTMTGQPPYISYFSNATAGAGSCSAGDCMDFYGDENYNGETETQGPLLDVGSNPVANLSWFRQSWTSTWTDGNGTSMTDGIFHEITGTATFSLPTSGNYTYAWVGGTNPTDVHGNVGTLTSGGSWNVNFTDRSIGTASPVAWSLNGINYSLTVPTQTLTWTSSTEVTSAGTYTGLSVNPITNFSLNCGAGCTKDIETGNYNVVAPWFFGANAEALGVGVSTEVIVGGQHHNSNHVQAYTR